MTLHKTHEASLGDLLLSLRRKIVESFKKEAMAHDLTFSQIEILQFIGKEGKKTMRSIADYLKITPPSATNIIAEMEHKGLVVRTTDTDDRRVIYITMTKNTQKLFASICKRKEIVLKKMVSKLGNADQKSLERIIKIIITE